MNFGMGAMKNCDYIATESKEKRKNGRGKE